jgi:hypothetical protein
MITADVATSDGNGETYDKCFDRGSILECNVIPSGEKYSDLVLENGDVVMDVPTTAFNQYQ